MRLRSPWLPRSSQLLTLLVFSTVPGGHAPARLQAAVSPPATQSEVSRLRATIIGEMRDAVALPPFNGEWQSLVVLRLSDAIGRGGGLDAYQDLYLAGVARRGLAVGYLVAADASLDQGDISRARDYLAKGIRIRISSETLFTAASHAYAGKVDQGSVVLEGIYREARALALLTAAEACSYPCYEGLDYLLLLADFAVDSHLKSRDEATRASLRDLMVKIAFRIPGVDTAVRTGVTHFVGQPGSVHVIVDRLLRDPQYRTEIMQAVGRLSIYVSGETSEAAIAELADHLVTAQRSLNGSVESAGLGSAAPASVSPPPGLPSPPSGVSKPAASRCEQAFFEDAFDRANRASYERLHPGQQTAYELVRGRAFTAIRHGVTELQSCGAKVTLGGILALFLYESAGKLAWFNDRCSENAFDNSVSCWTNPKARYSYQYGLVPLHTSNFNPCTSWGPTQLRGRANVILAEAGFQPKPAEVAGVGAVLAQICRAAAPTPTPLDYYILSAHSVFSIPTDGSGNNLENAERYPFFDARVSVPLVFEMLKSGGCGALDSDNAAIAAFGGGDASYRDLYVQQKILSSWERHRVNTCQVTQREGQGPLAVFDVPGRYTWEVPEGVHSIIVDVAGAQGGGNGTVVSATGGRGGRVQAVLTVAANETLVIYVGGKGGDPVGPNQAGRGGFNGGADGGVDPIDGNGPAGGGGGASDIRRGGGDLGHRVVVAGGGGGAECCGDGAGGAGGGLAGASGASVGGGSFAGGGGTQASGGTGGAGCNGAGGSGASGQGGRGGNGNRAGGGGGGGYHGGGGGGGCLYGSGGGGGSSSSAGSSTRHTPGDQAGNGQVVISRSVPGDGRCADYSDFSLPIWTEAYRDGRSWRYNSVSGRLQPGCWSAWVTVESGRAWWVSSSLDFELEFRDDAFRGRARAGQWVGFAPPGEPTPAGYGSMGWHGRTFRFRGAEGSLTITVSHTAAEVDADLKSQHQAQALATIDHPQCPDSYGRVLSPSTVSETKVRVRPGCTSEWINIVGFNSFEIDSTVPLEASFDAGRHPQAVQRGRFSVPGTTPFCLRSVVGEGEAMIRVLY